METYFDSRLDLIQRTLMKHSDRLTLKAEVALNDVFKIKTPSGDDLTDNFDREVKQFKLKVSPSVHARRSHADFVSQVQSRLTKLTATWQSTKVV